MLSVDADINPKAPTILDVFANSCLLFLAPVGFIESKPVLADPETREPSRKILSDVLFAVNADDLNELSDADSVFGIFPESVEFLVEKYFVPFSPAVPPPYLK